MAWDSLPMILTLPSDLRLLGVARVFVESICQVGEVDQATADAIILAVNEAASNVIRHAHHNRGEAPLQIECRCISEGFEITLLDEGDPFDVDAVPELDP